MNKNKNIYSFKKENLKNLALGCAYLGSGGGGSTDYPLMIAEHALQTYGNVNIINIEDIKDDDFILPIGYAGSPLVCKEKIPSQQSLLKLINFVESFYKKKVTALTVTEIGGGNGLAPFAIASLLKLPILDADMLARAFPKISMISTHVHDIMPEISFLADDKEQLFTISTKNFYELEQYARHLAISAGSSICLIAQALTGLQAKKGLIHNSISNALKIGNLISKKNINTLIKNIKGRLITTGIITFIDQSISDGFSHGKILIEDKDKNVYSVLIKNEYLAVSFNDKNIIETPDIISLLCIDSLKPLLSDELQWNIQVHIVTSKTDKIWYSKKGKKLVDLDACLK